jgi:hypothetical protein
MAAEAKEQKKAQHQAARDAGNAGDLAGTYGENETGSNATEEHAENEKRRLVGDSVDTGHKRARMMEDDKENMPPSTTSPTDVKQEDGMHIVLKEPSVPQDIHAFISLTCTHPNHCQLVVVAQTS